MADRCLSAASESALISTRARVSLFLHQGAGGEEETPLRDAINKMTSEKQYGGTFRTSEDYGNSGGSIRISGIDETTAPGEL